jgi:alanyl-tRNA synthetase
VNARVESVLEELRATRNEVSSLKSKIAVLRASSVASKAFVVGPNNIRFYCISLFKLFNTEF